MMRAAELCLGDCSQAKGYLYVDTAWEHWEGAAVTSHPENAVAMAARKGQGRCTAVVCHGANPGLVQHFTKQVSKPCAQWDVGGKQASLGVGCNARTCILVCKLHAVLLCATSIHCIASALSKCRAADQQPCTVHDECQACSC